MSILPTNAQRSAYSSSRALSQNPNSDNGFFRASEVIESSISLSTDPQTLGSLQISESGSVVGLSDGISDRLAADAADSGGSSKKVIELRTPDGRKSSSRRNHNSFSQFHLVRGGLSSQLRCDQVGSAQPGGKSGADASPHNQSASGSIGFHGSVTHSQMKKTQTMNGNHLLNFHYDPISRPQPRNPPPRRQQKIKPYNKDLFLQANFKFVVLDTGNYALELMDPDKMFKWEDVICLRYFTPFDVQCPICLETPLCPQITSCGHIFCFPCILRYLLMGEEDHKGDCWKKCPLCFVMISSKDLYTLYIENVTQYRVGDHVQFALLTRSKDSLIPSQKNLQGLKVAPCSSNELCDSFSKFTFTSDVEVSIRQAKSELDGWLARAESGLVDDLEKLPYVCAALEQLEQRKTHWSEHEACSSSPPLRNHASPYSNITACERNFSKIENHVLPSTANADLPDYEECGLAIAPSCVGFKDESKCLNSLSQEKLGGDECLVQTADVTESFNGRGVLSSSYDENKSFRRHSNESKDVKEKDDLYTFYQAVDGQHLILHPLNMKCLLHYYGGYDFLPPRISGKILQLETVSQSEAMRRRYRFLSHFSLTTTFQLCEIYLGEIFPLDAMCPFIDEIKKRENERKRLAKKEHEEKIKAETAAMHSVPISSGFGRSSNSDITFSMDDFEALGSTTISSSPPLVGERKRFSDVTRLGFAAAHDSPSLKVEESVDSSNTGPRNPVTLSFANIAASTAKPSESLEVPKMNGLGKKGKKPSRVLMSTASSRRY